MTPAFLATAFFTASVIFATRSSRIIGSISANFWRLLIALILLGSWAHVSGLDLGTEAFRWFLLSGVIGFGVGDLAFFTALHRIGARLTSLLINCLSAPFAIIIEWLWLGTTLSWDQLAYIGLITTGVGLAIDNKNKDNCPTSSNSSQWIIGICLGFLASLAQAAGAVISRKAFAISLSNHVIVDGINAAYQRLIGGFIVGAFFYILYFIKNKYKFPTLSPKQKKLAVIYVTFNALCGPSLGVACYQWALQSIPSGIVLAIVSLTPLTIIPFTYYLDGDRPSWKAILGSLISVSGVVLLVLKR